MLRRSLDRVRPSFLSGLAALGAVILGASLLTASSPAIVSADSAGVTASGTSRAPGFGVFYVNGRQHTSNWSDSRKGHLPTRGLTTTYNEARVTYLLPDRPTGTPVVLVPGYGLSSDIWMTTPDQRMGWAQMLYAAGHPVYVLSPPDRGESMPVDQINKCLAGAAPAVQCKGDSIRAYYGQIGHAALEDAWPTWRFGPSYGTPFADSQFPSLPLRENYVEQFGASFVPYLGRSDVAMVDNEVMNDLTYDAINALLVEIGPAVIVLHSAAGTAGFRVAADEPSRVRAIVAIETTKCPPNENGRSPLSATPFIGVWGDHITPGMDGGHWERRQSCQRMARTMRRTGRAPAQVVSLPNKGIDGNSHMMMEDRNNQQVLGLVTDWLAAHGI